MTTSFVALLRGINVGGNNPVKMKDLVALATDLGLRDARTLLQSGNLVFRASGARASLSRMLADRTASDLGVSTRFLLRDFKQWRKVVLENPYSKLAKSDPGRLVVMVLESAPKAAALTRLAAAIKGPEEFSPHEDMLYISYPDGIGKSKLTNAVIERTLEATGTARNWNTVLKIDELLGDLAAL